VLFRGKKHENARFLLNKQAGFGIILTCHTTHHTNGGQVAGRPLGASNGIRRYTPNKKIKYQNSKCKIAESF